MKKYCLNADKKKKETVANSFSVPSAIHVTNVKSTSANDNKNS